MKIEAMSLRKGPPNLWESASVNLLEKLAHGEKMKKRILLRGDYQKRYIRWQDRRIDQLGFINNLFIGLTSVLLFWLFEAGLERHIRLPLWSLGIIIFGSEVLLLSLLSGLWLAHNRLTDFRQTIELIKLENDKSFYVENKRQDEVEKRSIEIEQKKSEIKKLGDCTWCLFKTQGILFVIGLILIGIAALLKISGV
jgi:hypothetical protein